jgi:hypothetical protein
MQQTNQVTGGIGPITASKNSKTIPLMKEEHRVK